MEENEVKVGQRRQFRSSGNIFIIKAEREGRSQYYYDCYSETNQKEETHSWEIIFTKSDLLR